MKNTKSSLLLLSFLIVFIAGYGQQENPAVKMKVLSEFVGHWHGNSTIQLGPGRSGSSVVDEEIVYKLDSTLIVIEGKGVRKDEATGVEKLVHHAFGILSYNIYDAQYHFQTFLNDGNSSNAWFTITGDHTYQWGFDVPQRKFRYSITLADNQHRWTEIGESSSDGTTWNKFFEMNLDKQ